MHPIVGKRAKFNSTSLPFTTNDISFPFLYFSQPFFDPLLLLVIIIVVIPSTGNNTGITLYSIFYLISFSHQKKRDKEAYHHHQY